MAYTRGRERRLDALARAVAITEGRVIQVDSQSVTYATAQDAQKAIRVLLEVGVLATLTTLEPRATKRRI